MRRRSYVWRQGYQHAFDTVRNGGLQDREIILVNLLDSLEKGERPADFCDGVRFLVSSLLAN